jgi:hypothetical protein|tara:strand:+ start:338 stop:805 length:468 start_codon:yes stop_codon:yes gene_type:complete
MAKILKQISTNAFVSLGCSSFKKLTVTNTGANACDFNLAAGIHKQRANTAFNIVANTLEGETSIASVEKGFYFFKSINIPAGVTLEIDSLECENVVLKQAQNRTIQDGRRVITKKTVEENPTKNSKRKTAIARKDLVFFASLDDANDSVNVIINK